MEELSPQAIVAIERVSKLLALARNAGANEHEAQNALDMAHKILEQHNLDMALVDQRSGKTADGKREDKKSGGGLYKWQREVWLATAKLNMCHYESIKGLKAGQQYENRVIGKAENVLMTRLMADYLQDTIERMAAQWAKDHGYQSRFVKPAIIFREGMADTITSRLWSLQYERQQESERKRREAAEAQRPGQSGSPGTSVVLASVIQSEADYNHDYLCGYEPGTTAARRAERDARMAVYAAQRDAAKAEHDRRYIEDEDYAQAFDAEEAKQLAEELKLRRKYERQAARRSNRPRPISAEDRRKEDPAYHQGLRAGHTVNLDRQINDSKKGALK